MSRPSVRPANKVRRAGTTTWEVMVGLPVCEALGLRLLLDGVVEEVVVEVEEEEAKDEEVCFFGDDVSAVVPAMVWKLSSSTMSMTTRTCLTFLVVFSGVGGIRRS
jgi:hypothetical protein